MPGDDKKTAALQMGDLLAGEWSAMKNFGELPSRAWELLTAHRGIAHLPADIPRAIPILVGLERLRKQIQDSSGKLLKRYHKDGERTAELSSAMDDLMDKINIHESALNALMEAHESDEGFRRFQKMLRAQKELE